MMLNLVIKFRDDNQSSTTISIGESSDVLDYFSFLSNISKFIKSQEEYSVLINKLFNLKKLEVANLYKANEEIIKVKNYIECESFMENQKLERYIKITKSIQNSISDAIILQRPLTLEEDKIIGLINQIKKINIVVGEEYFELAQKDLVDSFYYSILSNLESNLKDSIFPLVMTRLFEKVSISHPELTALKSELIQIQELLARCAVDKLVWDINDPNKQPPWGDNISTDVTDLSKYFLTNEGEYFFELFDQAIKYAQDNNQDLQLL